MRSHDSKHRLSEHELSGTSSAMRRGALRLHPFPTTRISGAGSRESKHRRSEHELSGTESSRLGWPCKTQPGAYASHYLTFRVQASLKKWIQLPYMIPSMSTSL